MKYIDLTHTFNSDMPVYPGDPSPELNKIADLKTEGFVDHQIKTGMHVGTHIDAPMHFIEEGKGVSDIKMEQFVGNGCLIDARGASSVGDDLLVRSGARTGDIVLVMTGFSEKFGDAEYYEKFPEIGIDFANKAVEIGIKAIGLDTPSPDRSPFEVHKILLGKEIIIIENLTNLELLVDVENFEVFALPIKLYTEGAPARVFARY